MRGSRLRKFLVVFVPGLALFQVPGACNGSRADDIRAAASSGVQGFIVDVLSLYLEPAVDEAFGAGG